MRKKDAFDSQITFVDYPKQEFEVQSIRWKKPNPHVLSIFLLFVISKIYFPKRISDYSYQDLLVLVVKLWKITQLP